MAKNNIKESQQQSQGVALGTQGNQDIKIPRGTGEPTKVKKSRRAVTFLTRSAPRPPARKEVKADKDTTSKADCRICECFKV